MLEKRGHSVCFIDIEEGERKGELLEKGTIKADHKRTYDRYALKRQIYKMKAKKRNQLFEKYWMEILGMTKDKCYEVQCDAVIIGSDEVFNCNMANPWGISLQLFGKISCAPVVLSYAASCGYSNYDDVPEEYKKPISIYMENMKEISVRDNNTHDFVQKLCGRNADVNLDPVLIYDFEKEISIIEKNMQLPSNYMIVYAYKNRIKDPQYIKAIKDYAKKNKLRIISLGDSQYWADDYLVLHPFEMLVYFKHATCVVTDTFHGTIMAAKYHRKLAVIVRESNKEKLADLLTRVKINKHKCEGPEMISSLLKYEDSYELFDQIVEQNRSKTELYFEKAGV